MFNNARIIFTSIHLQHSVETAIDYGPRCTVTVCRSYIQLHQRNRKLWEKMLYCIAIHHNGCNNELDRNGCNELSISYNVTLLRAFACNIRYADGKQFKHKNARPFEAIAFGPVLSFQEIRPPSKCKAKPSNWERAINSTPFFRRNWSLNLNTIQCCSSATISWLLMPMMAAHLWFLFHVLLFICFISSIVITWKLQQRKLNTVEYWSKRQLVCVNSSRET